MILIRHSQQGSWMEHRKDNLQIQPAPADQKQPWNEITLRTWENRNIFVKPASICGDSRRMVAWEEVPWYVVRLENMICAHDLTCYSKDHNRMTHLLLFMYVELILALPSKKLVSQPLEDKCTRDVVRIGGITISSSEQAMKSQVLHNVWWNISGEVAGKIWLIDNWKEWKG